MNSVSLDRFDNWRSSRVAPTIPVLSPLMPIDSVVASISRTSTPTNRLRECVICRDTDVVFASTPPTDRCLHQPETCVDCISQMLRVAVISESNSNHLKCPTANCRELLEHDEVQKWADHETFERYSDLLVQRLLQGEENYVHCIKAGCGAGQVHSGENIFPIVTCHRCGHKSCYRHRVEWHEGYSCKDWDNREERWAREDVLSQEWVQEQTKRCPNPDCNRPIRKEEGCDHMTCRRPGGCGHEFCWMCLASYRTIREQGNHHHQTTCRYYRPMPSSTTAQPPVPLPLPPPPVSPRSRWRFWRR
ncbi:hypothetical protein FS842_008646 [Serendipita sp. 407]|nr:hypothetical protein FRC15_003305 [Serendipita sp. 397]KAG8838513.1 hypothetical protein FRC18_004145 [Serendipita sp. 400]KAG8868350.1 hypothetical protein FRC20_003560 [Serendipita sp. 405]KAG9057075.1 hypothetical protein FS842_008646 [Serendipita sp. 407]